MRRFLGGRQPLCGTGVISEMLVILKPAAFNARTADSRPGPGPLMRTSRFLTPHSTAALPPFVFALPMIYPLSIVIANLLLGTGNRLARPLAGTGVGTSALTTARQAATMTHAAIAAQVHQTLDI